MTGLAQSARDAKPQDLEQVSDHADLTQEPERGSPGSRPPAHRDWSLISGMICGVVAILALAWYIFLTPGEMGSKAEWFFGAVVFCVVMVSMWQIVSFQRQARHDAAEAAERLRTELAAAEERAERELALTQKLHRAEMEAQQKLHRAEMDAQREVARVERTRLRNQLQRQAAVEVSRAVSAHTQMLATLWNEGACILEFEDRDEREQAMNPIFEQIGQVVNDFSVELSNAHLLVEDDRLHHALDRVNEAAIMAIRVAEDVHGAVIDGRTPQPNPITPVQQLMQSRAAEARRLAWNLLRTGLDDGGARSESDDQ